MKKPSPQIIHPRKRPRIIGVDPGGVTGLAHLSPNGNFQVREFGVWQDAVKYVVIQASIDPTPTEIAVEHFTINTDTAKSSPQYDALYCIGALEYVSWVYPHLRIEHQPVQKDHNSLFTDDRLRKLGMFTATTGGHANDAARHCALRALHLNLIDKEELML